MDWGKVIVIAIVSAIVGLIVKWLVDKLQIFSFLRGDSRPQAI